MRLFEQVYEIVKKVPLGKVATYGQIAEILRTKDARKIGWALHANKNPDVPCHRVVNKDGNVAENYAFGSGGREQKNRLVAERVSFIDGTHVNLKKHLWKGLAK